MTRECRLQITSGPFTGRMILVDSKHPVSIGRVEPVDVRLDMDPAVSRRHLTIEFAAGGFRLRDEGSTNGTFLNGVLTASAPLRRGDRIVVGQTLIEVVSDLDDVEGAAGSGSRSSLPGDAGGGVRGTQTFVHSPSPLSTQQPSGPHSASPYTATRGSQIPSDAPTLVQRRAGLDSVVPAAVPPASISSRAGSSDDIDSEVTLPIGSMTLDASQWTPQFRFEVRQFGRTAAEVESKLREWALSHYVRAIVPLRGLDDSSQNEWDRVRARGGMANLTETTVLLDSNDRLDPIDVVMASFGRNQTVAFLCAGPFSTTVRSIADRLAFLFNPTMVHHQVADRERSGLRGTLPGVAAIVVEAPSGQGAWILVDRTAPGAAELMKVGEPVS